MAPSGKGGECVKVVVRCRPMSEKEIADGHERGIEMDVKRGQVTAKNPKNKSEAPRLFTFDAVYDWNSKQRDLYDETFRSLVENVLEGYNGTIFAYGQTGTGKTFTMQGVKDDEELRGVIPNSFEHVFQHIGRSQNQQYLVRASYLEIYMEEIRDLLSKDQSKRLELKEKPDTGVYVKDLLSFVTKNVKEIEHVMEVGNRNRSVGATNMNLHSSRSHAIFIITIECCETREDMENHIRVGKLNLVDLAGSERQAKTGATGDRFKEATKINLSLSALGNVISALVDGKSTHVPYRDSKLTRLLQDSLGGNSKTVMVANIGPADWNFEESITTLRYANRAKNIKNRPKINEDPKDALLREFQEEIARLRSQLANKGGGKGKRKSKGGKRKTRVTEDGEVISEDEEDDVDDEESLRRFAEEQKQKLEEEKQSILNNKDLIASEKEKLLEEVNSRGEQLEAEKGRKEELVSKIEAMESKLLCGGKNIVDHTNEQERQLEQRRIELFEHEKRERELQDQLDQQEESAYNVHETYTTLKEEVEIKTKKLKKLFLKLNQAKQEIADLQEEHVLERQQLEETQQQLLKEIKLKLLIIDNFVPPHEKEKLKERAYYDDDNDSWALRPLAKSGSQTTMAKRPLSAVPGRKRAVCEFAKRIGDMQGFIRFRGENIIMVELDKPNRTTRDYEGPVLDPSIQAALNQALADEDDLDLDAKAVFASKPKVKERKDKSRPKISRKPATDVYPSARGMVQK